ncbi:hypothetical protein BB561_006897 [Smittium simulii]|uniref:Uncharacterized protein n=1 Tax=Smittium simulii TaxID=133385 RepID=A0A2T9Y0C9_9FUNG|nr:hypothetical protein BB561_006897 [Smittium simulii]
MKIAAIYFLASVSIAYAAVTPLKISNGSNMSKRSTHKKIEYLPMYDLDEQDDEAVDFKRFNRSLNDPDLSASDMELNQDGEVAEGDEVAESDEISEDGEVVEDNSVESDFDLSASDDTENTAVPSPVIAQAPAESISEFDEEIDPSVTDAMQAPVAANNYSSQQSGSNGYDTKNSGSNGYNTKKSGSNGYNTKNSGSNSYNAHKSGSNSYYTQKSGSNVSIFVSFKGRKYGNKEKCSPNFYQKLSHRPKNYYGNLFELCYQSYPSFKNSWNSNSKFRIDWEINVNFRNQCVSKALKYNKVSVRAL